MKDPMRFRIDFADARMPRTAISLEVEAVEGIGSIAISEDGKPWVGKWVLSESALRALAIAASALADHVALGQCHTE
jgi:hypothetical protein